jgi:hypothetical protein
VIGVRENGEWQLELADNLAVLVLIVDADCQDLGALGGELLIVAGQTGQLPSAEGSPVASVEHQDDLGLVHVVLEGDAAAFAGRKAELRSRITGLR